MQLVDPGSQSALKDRATFYREMRKRSPVAKVVDSEGEYYIVTGYDAVKDLLNDTSRFTKIWGSQRAPLEHGIALNQDPPNFNHFRAMYVQYMSPSGVRRWSADCRRVANDLVDKMLPMGAGDMQDLLGKPLPARVAAIALGFPEDQVDLYRFLTDSFLSAMIADPVEQKKIIDKMYAFFIEQFDRNRELLRKAGVEDPGPEHVGTVLPDTLVSVLMTSKPYGRHLTNDELCRTVRGFFLGGVDTTGALVLNTLRRLLEQRELWEQVCADPGRLIPIALEESLRFDPPAIGMFRGAVHDVEIAGETIPAGARVLYSTFGANRDPDYFEDPDTFRLDRPRAETPMHVSFGYGPHFCPGAWTGRLEARLTMEILVERLPKLRLTGPVEHFDIINFFVVKNFPAAWD